MLIRSILASALVASTLGAPALAVPGGEISTLPTGRYQCERPGDVTGLVAVRVPEADFRVLTSSSYAVEGKRGSYLLTGDDLVMTGGPFEGRRFVRTSVGYLRGLAPDGKPGDLRCVLAVRGTF